MERLGRGARQRAPGLLYRLVKAKGHAAASPYDYGLQAGMVAGAFFIGGIIVQFALSVAHLA